MSQNAKCRARTSFLGNVNARTTHYMLIRRHHTCPGSTIARYKHAVYAVLATLLFGTPSRQLWTRLGSYQNCTSLVLNRSTAALPLLLLPLPPPMLPGLSFQWLTLLLRAYGLQTIWHCGLKATRTRDSMPTEASSHGQMGNSDLGRKGHGKGNLARNMLPSLHGGTNYTATDLCNPTHRLTHGPFNLKTW